VIPWIDDDQPLPPAHRALGADSDAPGLVAAGAGPRPLRPERLEEAYRQGLFPWYSAGQPVLWWSPDPRMVLPVADLHLSHSLRKTLRRFLRTPGCELRFGHDLAGVMQACAQAPRDGQDGTWIVPEMQRAYVAWQAWALARGLPGRVLAVSTWVDGRRVGGLYAVTLGRMVCGESMFAHASDASKIALAALVAACRARGVALIDCQQNTRHLASLGAREMPRRDFIAHVQGAVAAPEPADWTYDASHWALLGLDAAAPTPTPPDPA
jgi:leucyl/phenylalanyl-tRNA---protein transferase